MDKLFLKLIKLQVYKIIKKQSFSDLVVKAFRSLSFCCCCLTSSESTNSNWLLKSQCFTFSKFFSLSTNTDTWRKDHLSRGWPMALYWESKRKILDNKISNFVCILAKKRFFQMIIILQAPLLTYFLKSTAHLGKINKYIAK